jgi:hypothetical protein
MSADTLSIAETAERLGFGQSTLERRIGRDAGGREVIELDCGSLPIVRIGRARRVPAVQVDFVVLHGRTAADSAELVSFARALRGEQVPA